MKTKTAILLLMVISNNCFNLSGQTLDRNIYTTNGPVYATIQSGDTLYVGGNFTQMGYGTKLLARYEHGSSKPDFNFVELDRNTSLYAIEPDGNGGYYLGGIIFSYKGTPLNNGNSVGVIHILSDYSLDPTFRPTDLSDFYIQCLKKHGNRLYIGGHFYTVNGVNHENIAALNATTGAVINWHPDEPYGDIDKIEVSDSLVFIHGGFFTVGSHNAYNFAPLRVSDGKYARYFTANEVTGMAIKNKKLFLGGNFTSIGFKAEGLAKVNIVTAHVNTNFPETNGSVNAILPDGNGGYYIAGGFSLVDTIARMGLAHILPNGKVDPDFNVEVNEGGLSCLATDGVNLYLGGRFSGINGVARSNAAAVVLGTGTLTPWNPQPNDWVGTMVYSKGKIYMGGSFNNVKAQTRYYAAAVTVSNVLTAWNPEPDFYAQKIISNSTGTSLFIAGDFTYVKGILHRALAKVNSTNGNVAPWNPNPDASINALVLRGSKLFIGGSFLNVNGIPRQNLAEIDTASNGPTAFRADVNNIVNTLIIDKGKLYIGGTFTQIQNVTQKNCARIDLTTKILDAWSPEPDSYVWALAPGENGVVIGGGFRQVNDRSRNYIGVIDLTTHRITSFNPRATAFTASQINAFAFSNKELFAGGVLSYDNADNSKHYGGIIAFDSTGFVTRYFDYSPDIMPGYTSLNALAVSNNRLYAGGNFGTLYNSSQSNYINRFNLVSYNLSNNHLTPDLFNPNNLVHSLLTDNSDRIIIAGNFDLMGYVNRINLAAVNLTTGRAISWFPIPAGQINALALKDTTLFIGGSFTAIYDSNYASFENRQYLAALSTRTGKPTAWNSDANGYINTLSFANSTLYVGGYFTTLKGLSRNYAAAIGVKGTGLVKSWAPNPNAPVLTLLDVGTDVYMGGSFTTVKGMKRNYLALVNNINGNLNCWNPNPNSPIYALDTNSTTLYVGGFFTTISRRKRQSVAAYTMATNELTTFNPQLKNQYSNSPYLYSLAIYGKTLFMGSDGYSTMDSIKGTARHILGAADTINGRATGFNPHP
ncbi:MAG TPA: hypothetical protein VEK36_00390, partial [Candidatus Paceibacterota bacterium]|nr:hypothetical protein [Candidatus Paceibacterota bacterium]